MCFKKSKSKMPGGCTDDNPPVFCAEPFRNFLFSNSVRRITFGSDSQRAFLKCMCMFFEADFFLIPTGGLWVKRMGRMAFIHFDLGGGFKYFWFSPLPGKMMQFD